MKVLEEFVHNMRHCIVCIPKCGTPVNDPLGVEKGINPGRVVFVHRKNATLWDGYSNYYWDNDNTNYNIVKSMLDKSMISLSGEKTVKDAWDAVFKDFNKKKFGIRNSYKEGEKIAIKLNLNTDNIEYKFNNYDQSTPQFLKALVTQMCSEYEVKQEDLFFYDASRTVSPKYWDEPTGIGKLYPNVNFVDNLGGKSYVKQVEKDDNTLFICSSDEVPDKDGTKLPTILTQAKYVIEINNFRGHDMAVSRFGSIWRPNVQSMHHWSPRDFHPFCNATGRLMGTYNVLVDLLGHDDTAGKGLIFFSDGLYGGPTEMNVEPIKFLSKPFDNWWSSSIFVSQDPIALDSVLYDFLRNEPNVPYAKIGCVDNYLHEASQLPNPPSKIVYNPTGKKPLQSLGCHEHWNNADDKQYSRNLGKKKGLELVII